MGARRVAKNGYTRRSTLFPPRLIYNIKVKAEEGEILFSAASDHTLCREEDGESLLLHEDEEEDERGEKEQWALTNTELG